MNISRVIVLSLACWHIGAGASEFFDYKVVASSANGNYARHDELFTSINDRGDVAFIARTMSSGIGFTGVFASIDDQPAVNIAPMFTLANADYGELCQINNDRGVIASLFNATLGSPSFVDVYDAEATNVFTEIATHENPNLEPFLWLGNLGLSESGNTFFFSADGLFNDAFLTTPSGVPDEYNMLDITTPISSTYAKKSGDILVRFGIQDFTPGVAETEGDLRILNQNLGLVEVIETVSPGRFSEIGMRPSVSGSNNVVVFGGILTQAGADSINTTQSNLSYPSGIASAGLIAVPTLDPGPGIFASVKTQDFNRLIVRLAGENGNARLDPGESFIDIDADGVFDPMLEVEYSPLGSFDISTPVLAGNYATNMLSTESTSKRSMPIAFEALRPDGTRALFQTRLNFFGAGIPVSSTVFADFGRLGTISTRPIVEVVGINDSIPNVPGLVTDFAVYDSLNERDRGDVSFGVRTSANVDAVIRARPVDVFYLEFEPNNNFVIDNVTATVFKLAGGGVGFSGWFGSTLNVFESLAPGRMDLVGASNYDAIEQGVREKVQSYFDTLGTAPDGANVKIILNDTHQHQPPPARMVYIGDGPQNSGVGFPFGTTEVNGLSTLNDFNNGGYFAKIFLNGGNILVDWPSLYENGNTYVFVDTIFASNGEFTSESGVSSTFVSLADTTGNLITPDQAENAMANTIAHEIGHNLGLRHFDTSATDSIMIVGRLNPISSGGILANDMARNEQAFLDQSLSLLVAGAMSGTVNQNSARRLAFAAGSDSDIMALPRNGPPAVPFQQPFLDRRFFQVQLVSYGGGIEIVNGAIGVSNSSALDVTPSFASLGSGELSDVLDRVINYGEFFENEGRISFIASTTGDEIDLFGVPFGEAPNFDSIDLTNGLGVLVSSGLRSNIIEDFPSQENAAILLDVYQKTGPDQFQIIGRIGLSKFDPSDVDSDGVEDAQDNCLIVSNPDQSDPDNDGFGLACDADLDNSGVVNFIDLVQFQQAFLSIPTSNNWNPDADFDNSGAVNFSDLVVLQNQFLQKPGPSGTTL